MKRVLLYIGIAIAAIGCTKDETTTTTPADGAISFSAGVATRVASSDDCAWGSDDEIGIFTDQTDDSQNMKFTISDTSTGAMNGTVLYPLISGKRTYYAYHPYDGDLTAEATTIRYDLRSSYSDYLLYATTTSNDTDVALQFTHMLPKVTFNLTAGGVDVTSLKGAKVWLTGANAAATFDITSGGFKEYEIDDITLTLDDNGSVTAYLLPTASVSDNVKLWITAQDSKNNTFVKSLDTEEWTSGNSYEYDITVGEVLDIELVDETYQIYTAVGLQEFVAIVNETSNTSANILLKSDIDLSTVCGATLGEDGSAVNWTPIGSSNNRYSGNFDGGGHEISGLYINNSSSDYQGLFGYISGATISNLGVSGSVSGKQYTGGVVGYVYYSTITACYNNCAVEGSSSYTGGVAGYVYSSDKDNLSSLTSCYNTGSVSGEQYTGGIVGRVYFGTLTYCYNSAAVKSTGSYTGGIAGQAYYNQSSTNSYVTLTSCYSSGSVSSTTSSYIGGVLGHNYFTHISYCYYDNDTVDDDKDSTYTITPTGAVTNTDYTAASNDLVTYTTGLTTANMTGAIDTNSSLLYYFNSAGYGSYWTADTESINNGYPILTNKD